MENRGRDILPFLKIAARLLEEGEQIVLKLHTKRSPHRNDGDAWRRDLILKLLGAARADAISTAFRTQHDLGLVAPEGHLQPLSFYWGANERNVVYLAARLGLSDINKDLTLFASGSMYWVRLDAMRSLLDTHLGEWDFEGEHGHEDGTLAHAIERVINLIVASSGFRAMSAAEACGEQHISDGIYPHANRS